MSTSSNPSKLPQRDYGSTGVKLSIIGFGGLLVSGIEQAQANRLVAESVERGVTYFDVAPTYGNAEERLGPALEPWRKGVFLACKTTERTRAGAAAELQRSLERLRTGHVDLYQLHALTDVAKDVDVAFGKGGAMEAVLEARKDGRVRFVGFSAHSVEAALAAMDRFNFDSVLFQVNYACWLKGDYGPQIMRKAREKGAARLALKTLARQKWPKDDPDRALHPKCWYQPVADPHEADLALRFTLGQPITAAIPPGEEKLFRLALDIASRCRALSPDEEREVQSLAAQMDPLFEAR